MKKRDLTQSSNKKINISLKRRIMVYTRNFILCAKILPIVVILLALFTKILDPIKYYIQHHIIELTSDMGLVLENVIIMGNRNFSNDDVVSYLNADVGTPIFSMNIDEIRSSLEKNDWVRSAIVERRLPNTICIKILERQPIAIWQNEKKLYLVDSDSYVMNVKNIDKFFNLLHVVGVDAHLQVHNLIAYLMHDKDLMQKVVSAVRYGERRWNLVLENGVIIKMPQDKDFNSAYSYVSKLNKADKLLNSGYKVMDLRDKTKYYFEYVDNITK